MRRLLKVFPLLMAVMLVLAACADSNNDGNDNDDADWSPDESNGTLTIVNNTDKDIIIFHGQTPSASNILGGIRAFSTETFDLSDDVDDFDTGGYLILRGITLDEYNAKKTNLSSAKVEYSAMATYGQGIKCRAEISPNGIGNYAYRITNSGHIGLELRKGGPAGEKIAYIPALSANAMLYSDTADALTLFPVYVYFSKSTGQLTTLKPAGGADSVSVMPGPVDGFVPAYLFPDDTSAAWDTLTSLVSPVAYISVSNEVANQAASFTVAGSKAMLSQNGFGTIGSGEKLTFEVQSTDSGAEKSIVMTLYAGTIQAPVRFAGETNFPTIRNGYDYNVTLTGSGTDAANYSAVITEVGRRDISDVMAF